MIYCTLTVVLVLLATLDAKSGSAMSECI